MGPEGRSARKTPEKTKDHQDLSEREEPSWERGLGGLSVDSLEVAGDRQQSTERGQGVSCKLSPSIRPTAVRREIEAGFWDQESSFTRDGACSFSGALIPRPHSGQKLLARSDGESRKFPEAQPRPLQPRSRGPRIQCFHGREVCTPGGPQTTA